MSPFQKTIHGFRTELIRFTPGNTSGNIFPGVHLSLFILLCAEEYYNAYFIDSSDVK